MARLIHRLYNERAFRRERVIRDRSNPLDIYIVTMRFRFCQRDKRLQFVSNHNAALTPAVQLLIALCFYANGAFQNTVGDMINVHKSTACRLIQLQVNKTAEIVYSVTWQQVNRYGSVAIHMNAQR